MKRAFVTIANSYVGSIVATVLHDRGYEVFGSLREKGTTSSSLETAVS